MSLDWISIEDELAALNERMAMLLEAVAAGKVVRSTAAAVSGVPNLAELAAEELRERGRRSAHFPANLFGEPAWDILLDLYLNACRGKEVSVSSACLAAQVPATTGLRWVGLLEAEGFIARRPSERDRRTVILDLTADGRSRVERTLHERMNRRMLSVLAQDAARTTGNGSQGNASDLTEKLLIIDRDDLSGRH